VTQPVPYYPEQGVLVREDALPGLLPPGLRPEGARRLLVDAPPAAGSMATGATMGR